MTYQCIACKKNWITNDLVTEDISHGFCKECVRERLAPIYQKKQLDEGHFDCFARSMGYCDQINCKYRPICI